MPIVRQKSSDIDTARLLRDLAARPVPGEAEIEAQAVEDGDAWTAEDFARAVLIRPPPTAEQVRTARLHLGMTEWQFAHQLGLTVDDVRRFDTEGVPHGPVGTLLFLVVVDPDGVLRLLDPNRAARGALAETV